MTLQEIKESLGLVPCCSAEKLDQTVTGAYAGDLLSDVMAHCQEGNIWLTIQVHVNIVGVAVLKDLAAIVLVNGREPAPDTLEKAIVEKMPILTSRMSAYELSGRLYSLGVGAGA